jgi:hypothetical protein
MVLGGTLRYQGRIAEGLQLAEEGFALFADLGSRLMHATATLGLAFALHWAGDYEQALARFNQVEADLRELQDQIQLLNLLLSRGGMLRDMGRYAEAEADLRRCLREAEQHGNPFFFELCRYELTTLALARGDYDEAERENAVVITRLERTSIMDSVGCAYAIAAQLAWVRGQPAQARGWVACALQFGVTRRLIGPTMFGLRGAALLLADAGELARAVALGELARPLFDGPWAEDIWYRRLNELTATLPPVEAETARERGRAGDVWETAQALLAEVEAAGWGSGHAERLARLRTSA